MLQGSTWGNWWDWWEEFNYPDPADNHKVMFDGPNKTIWILEGVTDIDVGIHLYSDWKEWARLYDFTKFLQAFETEGGRPVSDTERLGSTFFLINNWIVRQINANTSTKVIGNMYAYDENGDPQEAYGSDPYGNKSITSQTSLIVATTVEYRDVVVEVPTPYAFPTDVVVEVPVITPVEIPAQGLTPEQLTTLNNAYEEARRSRAMQTNKVNITKIGSGTSALDTVQVFDDDGVTLLYTIVVTGDDADNRQVTYIKPYPT